MANYLQNSFTRHALAASTRRVGALLAATGPLHTRPIPLASGGPQGALRSQLYGLLTDPEHNPAIRGTAWRGTPTRPGVVDKMIRDDKVAIAESLRTAPLLSTNAIWTFKPHPRQYPEDIEHAKLCNIILEQVKSTLIPALLNFHRYGVGIAEGFEGIQELDPKEFPNHKTKKARVFTKFRSIKAKHIHSFVADPKDSTRCIGFYLYNDAGQPGRFVSIPKDRIVRLTTNGDANDFIGFGTYRVAYGPFFLRQFYRTIAAAKHDKFGLGTLISKAPANADKADEIKIAEMMYEYRSHERGYFSLPFGWDLGVLGILNNGGAIGTDVEGAIEGTHRDVFGAFGASFQTMGDAKFGSFALADVHQGNFDNIIQSDATLISKALCEADGDDWCFESHIRAENYPTALPATLHGRNFPTKDYTTRAKVLTDAVRYGAIRGGYHIERAILEGFNIRPDEIETWDYGVNNENLSNQ